MKWNLTQNIEGPIDSLNDGTIFYSGRYKNSGTDPFYSIGVNYSINSNLLLDLNHQKYDMSYKDSIEVSLAEQGDAIIEGQQQFEQNMDMTTFELSYLF
ncbi:MAG: hypothetical protein HWE27_11460 [Gammaproteobacteria bacterium]|nr:hypothetical protein [Gammaproteobacteria bacterium]